MGKWHDFVREWSKEHNMSYMCAATTPECSYDYHSQSGSQPKKKRAREPPAKGPLTAHDLQVQHIPQPHSRNVVARPRSNTLPTEEVIERERSGFEKEDRPIEIEKIQKKERKESSSLQEQRIPEPPSRIPEQPASAAAIVVDIEPFVSPYAPVFAPPSAVVLEKVIEKPKYSHNDFKPVMINGEIRFINNKTGKLIKKVEPEKKVEEKRHDLLLALGEFGVMLSKPSKEEIQEVGEKYNLNPGWFNRAKKMYPSGYHAYEYGLPKDILAKIKEKKRLELIEIAKEDIKHLKKMLKEDPHSSLNKDSLYIVKKRLFDLENEEPEEIPITTQQRYEIAKDIVRGANMLNYKGNTKK